MGQRTPRSNGKGVRFERLLEGCGIMQDGAHDVVGDRLLHGNVEAAQGAQHGEALARKGGGSGYEVRHGSYSSRVAKSMLTVRYCFGKRIQSSMTTRPSLRSAATIAAIAINAGLPIGTR